MAEPHVKKTTLSDEAAAKGFIEPCTILVLMGVSGVGKTTLGLLLAERLSWPFVDGDALHSSEALAKMTAGLPLTDADRGPWLSRVHEQIKHWQDHEQSGVLACSALKQAYRNVILQGCPSARLIYLKGSEALIAARLRGRRGHFMPSALLASQFSDLQAPEPCEQAVIAPVTDAPDKIVRAILHVLAKRTQRPIGGILVQDQGAQQ